LNVIEAALTAHREACERLLALVVHASRADDWALLGTRFQSAREAIEREREWEARSLFPALLGVDPEVAPGIARVREAREALAQTLAQLGAASPRHDAHGWRQTLDLLVAQLERVRAVMHAGGFGRAVARLDAEERERLAAAIRNLAAAEDGIPELDLRALEPPEPFLRIAQQLSQRPPAAFRALLPREPVPLYEVLREHGFTWRGAARADGSYELFIEPAARAGAEPLDGTG